METAVPAEPLEEALKRTLGRTRGSQHTRAGEMLVWGLRPSNLTTEPGECRLEPGPQGLGSAT